MGDVYTRNKAGRITLLNQATTTVSGPTTTVFGAAADITGFTRGWLVCSVIANASGSPHLGLQIAPDTTNWRYHSTIHPDLTTTANTSFAYVASLTQNVRVLVIPSSTTSSCRFVVRGEFVNQ